LKSSEIPDALIKYVFDKLEQHYVLLQEGPIVPSSADGVYQADGLIPEELRNDLIKGVYALENVDKSKLDWHPGSNEQMLDLVHPSLFCYVIDHTNPKGHMAGALVRLFGFCSQRRGHREEERTS
jgi:hypothetical protein